MMGSTCSNQRSSQHDDQNNRLRFGGSRASRRRGNSSQSKHKLHSSLRHAIVNQTPDRCIAVLYPSSDNYILEPDGTKTPKSLASLATDVLCRSLVQLDGALPEGLPPDVVSDIVESLHQHGAWNATTLAAFSQCELETLNLTQSRGVTDEWLKALMQNCQPPVEKQTVKYSRLLIDGCTSPAHHFMDVASSTSEEVQEDDDSSTSFVSATDNLMDVATTAPPVSFTSGPALVGDPEMMMDDDDYDDDYALKQRAVVTVPTQTLTTLDLSKSQHLTDQGLLQLTCDLHRLEDVRLDHCHSLTGPGLAILSNSHGLQTLSLAHCRRLNDISCIANLFRLESLSLAGCRCLTDRALAACADLICLRHLDLSRCDLMTDDGLEQLEGLEHLEDVSLAWCRMITDRGLNVLTSQPGRSTNLRRLRLGRCALTDVACLARLAALEELDLNGCSELGSTAVGKVLKQLRNLKFLDVSYCEGILRSGWQGKIDNLKSLNLCYSSVRDSHLGKLTNLPALEEINLDSCATGDWSMAHFADNDVAPNLRRLNLADSNLTDAGVVHVGKFKNLTHLSLFYCNISNRSLRHISKLTDLQVLNLDSRDISDDGLRHLKGLKKLKSLDIFSGRITSTGCAHIARIQSLECLNLCGGGVGDGGCFSLAMLFNLQHLNLSQNESITNHGAAALAILKELRTLNLSNTDVNSGVLRYFTGLTKLESLTMYGCRGMDYRVRLDWFKGRLPNLKCLRVDNTSEDEGIMMASSDDDSSEDEAVWRGMSDEELA